MIPSLTRAGSQVSLAAVASSSDAGDPRPDVTDAVVPVSSSRCLTHSLRRFGGAYRDAPVIAIVRAERVEEGLAERMPWLAANGIELRWVPGRVAALGPHATGAARSSSPSAPTWSSCSMPTP